MEVLKKTWWVWSVLGTIAAFLNPYVGAFAMIGTFVLFFDGISMGIGRTRCREKDRVGYQGIASMQSAFGRMLIVVNIVLIFVFVRIMVDLSTASNRKNMGFLPMNLFQLNIWVPMMLVISSAFWIFTIILLAFRTYDLYWNKNYQMKPRKVKFGFLKQPDTGSWWFRIWRGTGKIWFVFAICSFVAGSFNYPYPAFTCFRFFFFFPLGILWINIRTRLSAIRRCSNKQGSIYEACDSRARHELDMFRGKGMFLTSVIELWFIEAVLIITDCIAGAAPLSLSISILCDVIFISSMSYHVWGLAEKR